MLEEIYDRDETLTEDDYYDALLFLSGDAYPDFTEEEIEEMLENMLDELPEQYAESVLGTIGNIGKNVGNGALKFVSDHPGLVNTAATTTGALIGGPVGAKIGSTAGGYLTKTAQRQYLPQTGKALAVMQNPQAQTAIARASLGIGNGTTPLVQKNGQINLVPAATYIRGLIDLLQKSLIELDAQGIIPPASYSESLPFAEDIDLQAEWLVEQLVDY